MLIELAVKISARHDSDLDGIDQCPDSQSTKSQELDNTAPGSPKVEIPNAGQNSHAKSMAVVLLFILPPSNQAWFSCKPSWYRVARMSTALAGQPRGWLSRTLSRYFSSQRPLGTICPACLVPRPGPPGNTLTFTVPTSASVYLNARVAHGV